MSSPVSRGFRHLRRPSPGQDGRVPPGQRIDLGGLTALDPHQDG